MDLVVIVYKLGSDCADALVEGLHDLRWEARVDCRDGGDVSVGAGMAAL